MKRIILLIATIGLIQSVIAQTTYTGSFYASDGMGMHTDQYFNLTPNSGANSTNYWNVYHKDGGSILLAHYGAAQPYVQVGSGRWTNFIVNGNAGIGTATPEGLQVNTSLVQESSKGVNNVRLGVLGSPRIIFDANGYTPLEIDNYFGSFRIFSPSSVKLQINPNGFVGIGTASPDQLLTVNGTIHSKEVKVDLSVPGPDYVFEKDYSLPSLESVQSYIDQNKHLPEVPSAKEMEANGINLSEMNMLLLKKVEELTLYVIEQQRNGSRQENEIVFLKNEINLLKNKQNQK